MAIPIILSSGSLFNFDLDTVFVLAAETGFDGLELMVDYRRETYHLPHLQKLITNYQLPILAVHSPFAGAPSPWPTDPVAIIEQSVSLAAEVGAQTVVVHPPSRWLRLQALIIGPSRSWKRTVPLPVVGPGRLGHWLQHELPDFQAKTLVKVALENMPFRSLGPWLLNPHHFNTPAQLAQFAHLTLDTTHVGTWRKDLLDTYRQIRAKVAHIHLSNYNGQEHQLPHNGSLPLAQLLAELTKDQFAGLITLEFGPVSLQANDELKLKQNLQASLTFCREILAGKGY
jgi:sugar phosphate isomerase/epimerase